MRCQGGGGRYVCIHVYKLTYKVCGDQPIGEPSRGLVIDEILAVGREVAPDGGRKHVIVARVDDGVAERDDRRHHRPRRPIRGVSMRSSKQ